ncbi:hypothetical protein EDD18DRAFT_1307511 [Armillaria luteobubalina]|uniref:Caspase family p10 domain-containing protein n=1 Tax=Armillaria luteobubalina TaxID=153913 RepID=A0AA39QF19_9AGAR|nr:hypothetical protein EDD18DRAFT_1307511 [Armillaria luteobubalina]
MTAKVQGRDHVWSWWARQVARYAKGSAKYIPTGGQDSFTSHGYEVLSITVAHDIAMFASSGEDRSVLVLTTRRLAGHMGKIHVVKFNEDASVLASGSFHFTVLEEASKDAVRTISIDSTTIIAGSVDGHVQIYDLRKGEPRSDSWAFVTSVVPTTPTNVSYWNRGCFGDGGASAICGDEKGMAWNIVRKAVSTKSSPKVHGKSITWTEHHPSGEGEMITASADGTPNLVWRHPGFGSWYLEGP